MHSRLVEHVQFLRPSAERSAWVSAWVRVAVCGVLVVLLATGCGHAPERGGSSSFAPQASIGEPTEVERDSAISVLSSMQRSAFDSAFVALKNRSFTREVRTTQIDASGSIVARRTQRIRYDGNGSAGRIVSASDSGQAFQSGPFDALAPSPDPTALPANLASNALADNPAYLSSRTRAAFRYRLDDGAYRGTPVWIVTVQARESGQGPEQSIRYTQLTITRDARQLVAAQTIRAERALLFREDSRFDVRLQPVRGTWLPTETRFRARIDIPFRDPLEFRSASTYAFSLVGEAASLSTDIP